MSKRRFRAIITALEYSIKFSPEPDSAEARRRLFAMVWHRTVYPFSAQDTLKALRYLERHTELDISQFLPQPHSNELLRQVFSHLAETLSRLPVPRKPVNCWTSDERECDKGIPVRPGMISTGADESLAIA